MANDLFFFNLLPLPGMGNHFLPLGINYLLFFSSSSSLHNYRWEWCANHFVSSRNHILPLSCNTIFFFNSRDSNHKKQYNIIVLNPKCVTFRSSRFGRLKQRLRKCGITCEEFSSCEEGLPRSAVRQLSKELTRRLKWCPAATAVRPPGRWRQPSGTTSEGLPTCLTSPRTTRFVQLLKNDDAVSQV